jgi:hypothetical protein
MIRFTIGNGQWSMVNGQKNLRSSFLKCDGIGIQSSISDLFEPCDRQFDPHDRLFCFLVRRMFAAEPAIFVKFQLIRRRALILGCRVISALALGAC